MTADTLRSSGVEYQRWLTRFKPGSFGHELWHLSACRFPLFLKRFCPREGGVAGTPSTSGHRAGWVGLHQDGGWEPDLENVLLDTPFPVDLDMIQTTLPEPLEQV